jgi:hypothetical protein
MPYRPVHVHGNNVDLLGEKSNGPTTAGQAANTICELTKAGISDYPL